MINRKGFTIRIMCDTKFQLLFDIGKHGISICIGWIGIDICLYNHVLVSLVESWEYIKGNGEFKIENEVMKIVEK